jgi:hypothetical protein
MSNGLNPEIASPTPIPVIAFSEVGVSITLLSPYLPDKPRVVPKTPFGSFTPKPATKNLLLFSKLRLVILSISFANVV